MSTYDFEPDPTDYGPEPVHIANGSLRVPVGIYHEGNTQYMGNGIAKYCIKCKAHRPFLAGGATFGPPGLKHWACKLHTVANTGK